MPLDLPPGARAPRPQGQRCDERTLRASATALRLEPRADRLASNGWPDGPGRGGHQSTGDPGNGGTEAPEDFVWPSRGRQTAANDGRGALPSGSDGSGGYSDGGGGLMLPGSGAVRNGSAATNGSERVIRQSKRASPRGSVLPSPGTRGGRGSVRAGASLCVGSGILGWQRAWLFGIGELPRRRDGVEMLLPGGGSNRPPGGARGAESRARSRCSPRVRCRAAVWGRDCRPAAGSDSSFSRGGWNRGEPDDGFGRRSKSLGAGRVGPWG